LNENPVFIERQFNVQAKKFHPTVGNTAAGWKQENETPERHAL
jgi:hypothetical protein